MRVPKHERGSVLVQVVIALAVMFGFTALTTDYGMMAVRQRKLQSATDAAALAAGPEMHTRFASEAGAEAVRFAAANTAESENLELTWTGPYQLRVTAWSDVPTPFLRVLDSSRTVRRVSAVSEVQAFMPTTIVETAKVRPWGIPLAFFNPGGESAILYNQRVHLILVPNVDEQPGGTGDGTYFVQPFALDANQKDPATGPFPNYTHDVKFGYGKPLSVSSAKKQETWMISQPGNWADILEATWAGVMGDSDSLINRSANNETYRNDTWDQYNPDNPRLVFLPIYDRINRGQGTGDPKAQILGFTAFYVESMSGATITGSFVRHEMPYDGRVLSPSTVREPVTGILQFHLVK